MKKRYMVLIAGSVLGIAVAVFAFSSRAKAGALPVAAPVREVQYPFEKGKGLANIHVEDVFLGVGMITGLEPEPGAVSKDGYTGSVSFEMINPAPGIQLRVEGIRFVAKMPDGKDGRIFEPSRVYDGDAAHGRAPRIKFPEGKNYFPFLWASGRNGLVHFTFADLPAGAAKGELVITYQGQFPGKKRPAYYETRLPVTRKTYLRGR